MKPIDSIFKPPSLSIIYIIFIVIAGLSLPLLLIPVAHYIGYSEIIEEISKALVVLFLIFKFPKHRMHIGGGILFGFLFGLSETMLYLNNIFQIGDMSILWHRFIWTIPMHMITVMIMVFAGLSKKWFIIFGLIAAIIVHGLFNSIALLAII